MADLLSIDVAKTLADIERVKKQLAKVPLDVLPDVEMAVANYLINALATQEVPPYKKVTRTEVYGKPFQTEKQRRWFFWALGHNLIDVPYIRRGKRGGLSTQWHLINKKGGGVVVENQDPAAIYVYGDTTQNQLIARIGWKTVGTIVNERAKKLNGVILRAANKALKKAIPKP